MKRSGCRFEERTVQALSEGSRDEEITRHLACCSECRQAAGIMEAIRTRIADAQPASGLRDDARRIWYVSQCLQPSAVQSSVRRWYVVRSISLAFPLLAALVVLRQVIASKDFLAEATQLLDSVVQGAAGRMSIEQAAACAGALMAMTLLAVLRLALSD